MPGCAGRADPAEFGALLPCRPSAPRLTMKRQPRRQRRDCLSFLSVRTESRRERVVAEALQLQGCSRARSLPARGERIVPRR